MILASLPPYELKSSRSPTINSVSNAKQILTTLAIYAEEHDGLLPPDLRTGCVDVGMVDPSDLLVSPLDPAHREYIFLCPGAKLADLPPGTPVIRDPCKWKGKSVIGFSDGRVRVERFPGSP